MRGCAHICNLDDFDLSLHVRIMRALFVFFFTLCLSTHAIAQTRDFLFSADIEGTTATARHLKNDREWVDTETCTTPCQMTLELKRLGPIRFDHPEHGEHRVPLPRTLWGNALPVSMEARFETPIDPEEADFQARLAEAQNGPDRKAKIFRKIPPMFEARAKRSGWCVLLFRIDTIGYPRDLRIRECSEDMFSENALTSVQSWRYIPKIEGGNAIETPLKKTLVRFSLSGKNGKPIPPKREAPKR